ncbi:MAG: hypothetical protein SGCHY_004999 [Lobulomycetales sp.]
MLIPVLTSVCDRTHIVSSGQQAHHIASLYGMTVKRLVEMNRQLRGNSKLLRNELLCVENTVQVPSNCARVHYIQKGDNCADVASTNGIALKDFMHMNNFLDCESVRIDDAVCVSVFQDEDELQDVETVVKIVKESIPEDERVLFKEEQDDEPEIYPGNCTDRHTVTLGDTCASVAVHYNMTDDLILARNPEICCGALAVNQTVCVNGTLPSTSYINLAFELKNNVSSPAFCPFELRNTTILSNGTKLPELLDTDAPSAPPPEDSESALDDDDDDDESVPGAVPIDSDDEWDDDEWDDEPIGSGEYSPSEYLRLHDYCRGRRGLGRVSWDTSIESRAQEYANYLARECSPSLHHSNNPENLWRGTPGFFHAPSSAVQGWCAEALDGSEGTFNHHTQVAAPSLSAIGCGSASCSQHEYVTHQRHAHFFATRFGPCLWAALGFLLRQEWRRCTLSAHPCRLSPGSKIAKIAAQGMQRNSLLFSTIASLLILFPAAAASARCAHTIASKPCGTDLEYIVQRGDTLTSIAESTGSTVSSLMLANRDIYNPDVIYAGQRICIVKSEEEVYWNTNCETLETVPGDTCFDIAKSLKLTLEAFQTMNPRVNCGVNLQVGEQYCLSLFDDYVEPREIPGGYKDDPSEAEEPKTPATPTDSEYQPEASALPEPAAACEKPYTVAIGDTCTSIATAADITRDHLIALNPLLCCSALKSKTELCLSGEPLSEEASAAVQIEAGFECGTRQVETPIPKAEPQPETRRAAPVPQQAAAPRVSSGGTSGFLSEHNVCRADAGVRNQLTWSSSLEADARSYARNLVGRGCGLAHASGLSQGENLYWSSSGGGSHGVSSVRAWCSEGLNRGFNHHTQCAWRTTRQVGCAQESGSCGTVVVCRYYPAGNVIGRSYMS